MPHNCTLAVTTCDFNGMRGRAFWGLEDLSFRMFQVWDAAAVLHGFTRSKLNHMNACASRAGSRRGGGSAGCWARHPVQLHGILVGKLRCVSKPSDFMDFSGSNSCFLYKKSRKGHWKTSWKAQRRLPRSVKSMWARISTCWGPERRALRGYKPRLRLPTAYQRVEPGYTEDDRLKSNDLSLT